MDSTSESGKAKAAVLWQELDSVSSKWIQCEGFRCLGYKDGNGYWRNSFSGEILPKVIGILEI